MSDVGAERAPQEPVEIAQPPETVMVGGVLVEPYATIYDVDGHPWTFIGLNQDGTSAEVSSLMETNKRVPLAELANWTVRS